MVEALHWGDRVFKREAAARCCGVHPSTLSVLVHRMDGTEIIFSERQGGARVFSAKDIAVLRIAHELERGGQTWLTALARADDALQAPPGPDDFLVTPADSVSHTTSWITSVAPSPSDKTLVVVPLGRLVGAVIENLKNEAVAV